MMMQESLIGIGSAPSLFCSGPNMSNWLEERKHLRLRLMGEVLKVLSTNKICMPMVKLPYSFQKKILKNF
jgi:hypothetical protein